MLPSRTQRGFTLIEILAATSATAVVTLAATAFMLKALAWFDDLSAKIAMNRHARETFEVLAFGGRSATVGKDGTKNLYGVRGFNKAPPNGLRSNGALQYASNKLTLTPDKFASFTVTCTANNIPIPDCNSPGPGPGPGPGSTKTVQGWIGDDIKLDGGPKGVNNLTVNVTFTITDPFQASRADGPLGFSDSYRTIFTLNRDEDDPK